MEALQHGSDEVSNACILMNLSWKETSLQNVYFERAVLQFLNPPY